MHFIYIYDISNLRVNFRIVEREFNYPRSKAFSFMREYGGEREGK
jgi:hypothetical protein